MKPEYSVSVLHVSNVEASIKYYTGVLGFSVDFRYKDLAGVVSGNVVIYLSGPAQDAKKKIGEGSVYIFCDEVNEYCNNIIARGALIAIPINDREYGMRDFAISDPDGNSITFGSDSDEQYKRRRNLKLEI